MIDKKLYKKINLDDVFYKNDRSISIEYYLLETYYEDEEAQSEVKTFGVELVKKEYTLNDVINEEQKIAKHISINRTKVEKLLEELSNNTVTPMGLYSVLDNLIGVTY